MPVAEREQMPAAKYQNPVYNLIRANTVVAANGPGFGTRYLQSDTHVMFGCFMLK